MLLKVLTRAEAASYNTFRKLHFFNSQKFCFVFPQKLPTYLLIHLKVQGNKHKLLGRNERLRKAKAGETNITNLTKRMDIKKRCLVFTSNMANFPDQLLHSLKTEGKN